MRIGWGEYYRPETADQDLGGSVQWHARLQFIEAVDEISSIKDLMLDDTYPLFTLLVTNINHLATGKKAQFIPEGWSPKDAIQTTISWQAIMNYLKEPLPQIRALTEKEKAEGLNPNLDNFKKYIEKNTENDWGALLGQLARGIQFWALTFNLHDLEWLYEMVIVLFWRSVLKDGETWAIPSQYLIDTIEILPPTNLPKEKQSKADHAAKILNDEKHISLEIRHWHPLIEHRETAESRIINAFKEHLRKELDKREFLCQDVGLKKTPEKRNQEHFKWLAYHLLYGWDYEAISQYYTDSDPKGERYVGTDAVRKALKNTADLVGIELRK